MSVLAWPPSIAPLTKTEIDELLFEAAHAHLGAPIREGSMFHPAMGPRLFLRILATLRDLKTLVDLHARDPATGDLHTHRG